LNELNDALKEVTRVEGVTPVCDDEQWPKGTFAMAPGAWIAGRMLVSGPILVSAGLRLRLSSAQNQRVFLFIVMCIVREKRERKKELLLFSMFVVYVDK
jgi:hypothetical protein